MLQLRPRRSLAPLALALLSIAPSAQDTGGLELERGDTVCLLGNALAERMQHDGWLEVLLQSRFPQLELSVRNLGFGADELTVHQRTMNFGKMPEDPMGMTLANERFVPWDRYLRRCGADVVLAFFGYNESFAGAAGLEQFRADLESFVEHVGSQPYDGEVPAQLVLFGSIPHEDLGDPNLPDGREHNERIELYNAVIEAVARERGLRYVDVYTPMRERYAANDLPLTINGIHLNERGNAALAGCIEAALFPLGRGDVHPARYSDELRDAVREKNGLWFERYRATDGYNVYGERSRRVYTGTNGEGFANYDVLQREMEYLEAQCANRDAFIHALARGEDAVLVDDDLPPLMRVLTNKPGDGPGGRHLYRAGDAALELMTPAPGMSVEVFADERQFPELVNPVQMAWDNRGRLWVAAWPTYPHWEPDGERNDKLIILEDTDGDGRADESTVFAGDLHNPTGFEFWNGGVLVAQAPDLWFLKDTDGDDRVDHRERLLHGLSSADTHHGANSFVLGPDGALYFQEGTFHQSQVESIYGPVRNRNGCVWRYEPRTHRVERYIPYNYANPHGHVFDRWGQDFMTDGTGNVNYYVAPFSGHLPEPLKHSSYFPFFPQRSRPAGGTEFLSSSHFPEANQGNYLIANVIGFRGIFQYEVRDDGSGFGADEVTPIVQSSDPNFRPVDIEVGPDGALYFADWHNAIIGHLQHHLRDPSRDAHHGRIYRVTYEGRDLLEPPAIAGEPVEALLELLKSPEDRVRYRARIELSAHDSDEVEAAVASWLEDLDPNDPDFEHHRLEGLWLHLQHNRMDRALLRRVLDSPDPRARAAATRVVRQARHLIPNAIELIAESADDEHPRVRLEAVVAASFFPTADGVSAALEATRHPTDRFLDYALGETMRALDPVWKEALRNGDPVAADNPHGILYLLERADPDELVRLPKIPAVLQAIVTRHGVSGDERADAVRRLAAHEHVEQTAILMRAVGELDEGAHAHAEHVLHELGRLLLGRIANGEGPAREALLELATSGIRPATRGLGYAAWLLADGDDEEAWTEARQSSSGLQDYLAGVSMLPSEEARFGLWDRVRPLMFAAPAQLDGTSESVAANRGLDVGFFDPAPGDARRNTFDRRSPNSTTRLANFTLDFPQAKGATSFGLDFRGALEVPADGEYTFWVGSDDGSRLFLGDVCVVDNDGAHSMSTKSGEIELAAGLHPLRLTYFEQGGGEGLDVTWAGPGFGRSPIPDVALTSQYASPLRAAAVRAMASIPRLDTQKLEDAALLLGERTLLPALVDLVSSVDAERADDDAVMGLVETLGAFVGGLPAESRTAPDVAAALEVTRELASGLPEDARADALAQLEGLGGSSVLVRTLPHQMLFDLPEFSVQAGEPVAILFQNNDVMPHNLVVVAPGSIQEVGQLAETLAEGPEGMVREFVPPSDAVLHHTGLVLPGESERLTFVAPTEPGAYGFVCTYPGHWRVMNGVMNVVEGPVVGQTLARREGSGTASLRSFVKDWTLADLEPLLTEGWDAERSVENGRALFHEVGCIRCHTVHDEGAAEGPNLTAIREKYQDAELLRHVVDPSHTILEEYAFEGFELDTGRMLSGRVDREDDENLYLVTALLNPDEITEIPKAAVVDRWTSPLSPMPNGLLVTLESEEILDLLSYLQNTPDDEDRGERWVQHEGGEGPGAGKHIVLVSGDEEYRSEEALPMLARILSERHGFKTTVLFSQDPETGEIDPDEQTFVPGLELLDDADMMICFLRFRELPDEDMAHFVEFVESDKPILGIRTSTHAFDYKRNPDSPYAHYHWRSSDWPGGFGQQILGDTWINHHGHHGRESTRGLPDPEWADHPILRGVEDVWGPTDVYGIRNLPDDAMVLLRGQVLAGMEPESEPVDGPKNEPMMPVMWARELDRDGGAKKRIVASTIGAAIDCESEDLRRAFVNACYWGLGMEDRITPESDVDVVVPYEPTMFGFGGYVRGLWPRDHQ